jgi:hypothetical protein
VHFCPVLFNSQSPPPPSPFLLPLEFKLDPHQPVSDMSSTSFASLLVNVTSARGPDLLYSFLDIDAMEGDPILVQASHVPPGLRMNKFVEDLSFAVYRVTNSSSRITVTAPPHFGSSDRRLAKRASSRHSATQGPTTRILYVAHPPPLSRFETLWVCDRRSLPSGTAPARHEHPFVPAADAVRVSVQARVTYLSLLCSPVVRE